MIGLIIYRFSHVIFLLIISIFSSNLFFLNKFINNFNTNIEAYFYGEKIRKNVMQSKKNSHYK